jgi:hypothetical protein
MIIFQEIFQKVPLTIFACDFFYYKKWKHFSTRKITDPSPPAEINK